MTAIRPPAVAGTFYPAGPQRLRALVRSLLAAAPPPGPEAARPKALIVPHAGYVYSGPIAASGYARLAPGRTEVRRVVLLGTAHSAVAGLASSGAEGFATPLGVVPLDLEVRDRLRDLLQVHEDDPAHRRDHALEVQLPFLQETLADFAIVPLLVGRAAPEHVAEVLDRLWGGPETLVVVSSDLSHYHDHATACRLDSETARAIEDLAPDRIGPASACGHRAIAGLLTAARRHRLNAATLDLRTSGDTAGPRDRVVGYGAFAFTPTDRVRES